MSLNFNNNQKNFENKINNQLPDNSVIKGRFFEIIFYENTCDNFWENKKNTREKHFEKQKYFKKLLFKKFKHLKQFTFYSKDNQNNIEEKQHKLFSKKQFLNGRFFWVNNENERRLDFDVVFLINIPEKKKRKINNKWFLFFIDLKYRTEKSNKFFKTLNVKNPNFINLINEIKNKNFNNENNVFLNYTKDIYYLVFDNLSFKKNKLILDFNLQK